MIYLDNAASTQPAPAVLSDVAAAAERFFANPGSAHRLGAAAMRAVEEARGQVARLLGAGAGEIIFTSGGTEADALGILGAAAAARGRHVVVTTIEHPAVLRSVELLAARTWKITLVASSRAGMVAPEDIAAALRPETALIAVMLVNNELGTLQPVADIARAVRQAGHGAGSKVHIHTDAVQAFGLVPMNVKQLGVDSIAISGHKIHGPKGVGALWLRPGARLAPLWDGGRQEKGLRSGTENVPGCVGLGRAAALCASLPQAGAAIARLRDRLEELILERVPSARPTVAPGTPRAPHITSITIANLPAEPLLHALEARDVFVSAGSACASRTRGPSHVLKAIGVRDEDAVLRFSLSRMTTESDVDAAATALRDAVLEIGESL